MAECRRRVRLAVRADQLSRRSNRDAAERAWRRRQAQELGIELRSPLVFICVQYFVDKICVHVCCLTSHSK